MQKEDLKQIEGLFQRQSEGVEKLLQRQSEDLLKVVNERFEQVDHRFDEMAGQIKQSLSEVEERLAKVENLNRNIYDRMVEVTDTTMNDLRLDMDKVKFLHLDEWKGLPPQREISETLALEGLVS